VADTRQGPISLDIPIAFYILKNFQTGDLVTGMKIRIDEIKDKPLFMAVEEGIEEYPVLVTLQERGECAFLSPLNLQVAVAREYDHYRVSGSVEVAVRIGCSRCLADYETTVRSVFTIFYTKQQASRFDEEEVELAEQDLVSAFFSGEEIDLSVEIQEQVVMELPFKPLCCEECKGLCSRCGADLNQRECGCDRSSGSISFSALKDFKAAH
jgi:uncharacterized protein